jgi:tetratricopeptide (TPR) repeat protein
MFKKDNPHGKAHQPAAQNHPRATEILMNTVNQLPTFTLGADHDQAFPGNQVLQDTGNDCASLLVQLTPRPIKPAGEEEIASDPGAKHDLETASKEVKSVLHNPPSTKPWISAEESALQPSKTKNPAADQSWLDSKIHENDITAYRRVTELNPKNDRAWDALGNIYQSAGLHNEAAEAFEQAITLDPQREAYHYHLGIALGYLNQYAKAIQALNKVIELNPKYVLAHCALAGYYRKLGRETEVQEHIKIARPSMENENEYNQACFESISGDADRAIALLEIALEKQQIKQDMVRSDPDLDFIRKDSRFEALLAKNSIS